MKISTHAKERAFERYGIRFSKKRWELFGRTLRNPKYTVCLQGDRLACYFEHQWFLLIGKKDAVLTFLSLEDANDDDRQLLRGDERYRRINDDAFQVLGQNSIPSVMMQDVCPTERSVALPPVLTEEELPSDVLESAEKLMKELCGS